jgi:sarcosine oxidase subunit alpha
MIWRSSRAYKVSAAHHLHVAAKATWTTLGDWRVVESFSDPETEAKQVRDGAGLQDVSPLGKIDLKGAGVTSLLESAHKMGKVRGLLRIKPGHAIALTEANEEQRAGDLLRAAAGTTTGCLHVTDITSALSAYSLMGPLAVDLLNRVTALDVRDDRFPQHACAACELASVHATIYREDCDSALRGYLILVARDVGEYVWSALQSAGAPLGLTPFGVAAERRLRQSELVRQPTFSRAL